MKYNTSRLLGAFILFVGLALVALPQKSRACSCAEPTESMAQESYAVMDYVFEAEVVKTAKAALNRAPQVTMIIKRIYKGALPNRETSFAYNPTLHTCGFEFKPGQVVTLGAYEAPASQPRIAHTCAQMGVRKFLMISGGYPR